MHIIQFCLSHKGVSSIYTNCTYIIHNYYLIIMFYSYKMAITLCRAQWKMCWRMFIFPQYYLMCLSHRYCITPVTRVIMPSVLLMCNQAIRIILLDVSSMLTFVSCERATSCSLCVLSSVPSLKAHLHMSIWAVTSVTSMDIGRNHLLAKSTC